MAFNSEVFNCPNARKEATWCQPNHPDQLIPSGTAYVPWPSSIGINLFLSYNHPDAVSTNDYWSAIPNWRAKSSSTHTAPTERP